MNINKLALRLTLLLILSPCVAGATGLQWGSSSILTFRDCTGAPVDGDCATSVPSFQISESGGTSQAVADTQEAPGFGASEAIVQFNGAANAPVLSTYAIATGDGRVGSTFAAIQGYTYVGAESVTVDVTAQLSFDYTGGPFGGPGTAAVNGTLAILDPALTDVGSLLDCYLVFCLPPEWILSNTDTSATALGAPPGVNMTELVLSLTLNPGDSFFLGGFMQAISDRGASAQATLETGFGNYPAGFLDNLVPASLKVVPLPAAGWLMLSGLFTLLTVRRRGQCRALD